MSVSEPSSARSGVIPRGTRVEVFDEGQWHRGGKITSYVWGSNEYAILWDGCDETTMAGRHEVRRAVTEWQRVKHNNGFRVDSKKARMAIPSFPSPNTMKKKSFNQPTIHLSASVGTTLSTSMISGEKK